jgi:iron complex transport system substrate-binding protein
MPHYALQLLGIDGEYEVEASTWGEESIRLNELTSISEGYLVCFKPNDNQDIFQHPDWQALPAVINNQFYLTDPVWSYGGAMSVLYIAEAIAKTLMAQ